MALKGEAKTKYQRKYMKEYQRKRRAAKQAVILPDEKGKGSENVGFAPKEAEPLYRPEWLD